MPINDEFERIRPELVRVWKEKQDLYKRQTSQFIEGAQIAVVNYLHRVNFQTTIMRTLTNRQGHFSSTKWEGVVPMDGESLEAHVPAFSIDPTATCFAETGCFPGFKSQLIGRAGKATLLL